MRPVASARPTRAYAMPRSLAPRPGGWWLWYLGLGCAAAVAYVVIPVTPATRWVFPAVNLVAPLALLWGVTVNAPPRRRGWQVVALGLALSGAGDVTFYWYGLVGQEPPFPSLADPLYLAAHIVVAAGVALLARHAGRTAFADAAVVVSPLA